MVSNSGMMFTSGTPSAGAQQAGFLQQQPPPRAGRDTSSVLEMMQLGTAACCRSAGGSARAARKIASSPAGLVGVVDARARPAGAGVAARPGASRCGRPRRGQVVAAPGHGLSSSATTRSCTSEFWRRSMRRQVEAEHLHRADQRGAGGRGPALPQAVGGERAVDHFADRRPAPRRRRRGRCGATAWRGGRRRPTAAAAVAASARRCR